MSTKAHPEQVGLLPGEKGYFCGFDTLATAGHAPSTPAENVMLVGYEGGLRVYRLNKNEAQIIGSLEGLRGGVIGAKILPWTFRADPGSEGRPFVALILHGPVLPDDAGSSDSSVAVGSSDEDASPTTSSHGASGPTVDPRDVVKRCQTTVEIYSLTTRRRVARIFSSPMRDVEYDQLMAGQIPPPLGDLRGSRV